MNRIRLQPKIYLGFIIVIYLLLLLPTIARYGTSCDEYADLIIAKSFAFIPGGWLNGCDLDSTQTRLPMYLVAGLFAILNRPSLVLARLFSCFLGVLTIVAVYVFCKRNFDYRTGLLGCLILALNPYFLAASRVAFTEPNILFACALCWTLVCFSFLQEKQTLANVTFTALLLGLALSAKFSAIAIFPALVGAVLLDFKNWENSSQNYLTNKQLLLAAIWLIIIFGSIFGTWLMAFFSSRAEFTPGFATWHYSLVFLCWSSFIGWLFFHRQLAIKPWQFLILLAGLSFATFMVVPPVHTTTMVFVKALYSVALKVFLPWYAQKNLFFVAEAAFLHFGSVLFKPGLAIGTWLWLGLLISAGQFKRKKKLRLLLLVFIFYFIFLLLLPFARPYYMIPLLPILAILAAEQFFNLYSQQRFWAICLAGLAGCSLIVDLWLCYPDYHLNGFQWLGARCICGRTTIGGRSIVQTPMDGIEQALKWAKDNIEDKNLVVMYIDSDNLAKQPLYPGLKFQIVNGRKQPISLLLRADYVITDINSTIKPSIGNNNPQGNPYDYPYDVQALNKYFFKVFTVSRAFGLEAATIWRKKSSQ